jgi:hypothetical protein
MLGQAVNTVATVLNECFSTAGPRPSTGPWHQLYRAARGLMNYNMLQDFISPVDN